MAVCTNVNQAIAQWFISEPEKLKVIEQCSFYLDSELRTLTIDCPKSVLDPLIVLTGEMGYSMLDLGVVLVRLTCQFELISQFSPESAIYVQRLQKVL